MKILYVTTISLTINTFFKPHIQMLVDEGNQVDIACNDTDLPIDQFYNDLDCKIHHVDFSRSPICFENVKAFFQLYKIVEKGKYDIVHCHTPNASFITRLVCNKFRSNENLKVFYTAHGFHFYKGAPLLNWLVFYPAEKLCSFFTDKLITINKEDYELAKKKFNAKEVHYVPGVGIDLSKFENVQVDKAAKRMEIGVPEDATLLFSVGELNENKNHQIVIKALAQLNNPNIHYVIAGKGEKKNELLELAKQLDVLNQIHLLGFRKDIAELNHCANIFCFPSIREGLGLSAIEAMTCGVPVIAASNRGTKSFITHEENGFLCEANDISEFSKSISILLDNHTIYKIFSNKSKITATKYGLDNVIDMMKGIYGI